jgi:6-phosphogluconolactonase
MRSFVPAGVALFLALPCGVLARDIPDDLTIRSFAKPSGDRLHLLIRMPFKALNGINFPLRGTNGELDLARADAMLPSVARWWIAEYIDFYEGDTLLGKPQVVDTCVSLPSDNSFASYEEALAHVAGAKLPNDTQVVRDQAMLDVLLDYPIHSDRSGFAIHSTLARLGARVTTDLQFLAPDGAVKKFEYQGDPGLFRFDPNWGQAVQRFVPSGFLHILKGSDYLLFLFCVALLLRNFLGLIPFVAAFALAHSVTLIGSAYNLGSDALWFPLLIETLIAASIVYMAFENIAGGVVRRWWMLAFGFGLIYGFGFSFALKPAVQFAGSHVLTSVLSFNAGIELGQFLVLLLIVPALSVLLRFTVAKRTETIILAALAADVAWHRVTDRASQLSQFSFQWPALDAALLVSAMRWMAIFLVLGGVACLVFGLRRAAARKKPTEVTGKGNTMTTLSRLALFAAVSLLAASIGRAQDKVALYAAVGPEFTQYDVDIESGTLTKRSSVTLPANVQYAWPHPSRKYLYVAWSNGGSSYAPPASGIAPKGSQQGVTAFRIDSASGALHPHGQPASLPARPIHLSVDPAGTHVLVAYNDPSGVTVHRINPDGTVASEVKLPAGLNVGIYAHQVRVDPSSKMAILVTRGNGPAGAKPEDPGGLRIFGYKDGMLTNRASITPGGGFNFQPRHLDFHPSRPWVFVSLERQNKLQVYQKMHDEMLGEAPLFTKESLSDPGHVRPGQAAGTVHMHPNGRFIYQANRASGTTDFEGKPVFVGGENSIAVYAINQETGEPTLIQNADTRGMHPRTFALDASGRILVAANQMPLMVRNGPTVSTVPASLAVFRIRSDGKLDFIRKYDVEAGGSKPLYWMGLVSLP